MNARRLILVKHSLPEIVESVPPNRLRLSEKGKARCELLAGRLIQYDPDVIVSSVEPKAFETAQSVASHLGKSVEIIDGLHEHERTNVGRSSEVVLKLLGFELEKVVGGVE